MSTEGTIDYNSLSWVKRQLDTILTEAQSALSEYIETPDDESLMQKCIDELKLVYGTLQMVEVYGGAMLTEEMLQTANAQLNGEVDKPEDVFDVLMRAMLQLPDYLEGIQSGKKDTPIALLPLMNDLRTARKENLLSENVLFLPDVESVDVGISESDEVISGKLQAEAKRLRVHYQVGLLDFLIKNKIAAGLQRMSAVLSNLEKTTADSSIKRFWMVVSALLEALRDEGVDANISVKMLLGSVDRQIKQLIEIGEEQYADDYSQELLKNLLYYIGRSTSQGAKVANIKQAYKLDELLPSEEDAAAAGSGMAGLNSELFDTVSQGIREDLAQVKDTLEIFVHSSDKDVQTLAPLSNQLLKLGDTYGMLGIGAAREKILAQRNTIDRIISSDIEANEQNVMEVASNLLVAESELNNFVAARSGMPESTMAADSNVPVAEYREVLDTVIQEGLSNFSIAKEAILSFTTGIGDREQLDIILQKLEEVSGITQMLPMESIEDQLQKLTDYVRISLIENNHKPGDNEQDTVADVVTSIEYYLEAMTEGRPGVEQGLRAGNQAAEKLRQITERFGGTAGSFQADTLADEPVVEIEKPVDETGEQVRIDDLVEIELDVGAINTEPAQQADDHSVQAAEPGKKQETSASERDEYQILGDDPDEEILEIFIEEAVEVQVEMHEYLPKWIANREDEESLTVVRRNFHTLKGSGRLVGAMLIGEFSWKFENMLNRVLDSKIEPTDVLCEKVEEALAVLPQLVEQLQGNREPVENVYELMDAADSLSEGRQIPEIKRVADMSEVSIDSTAEQALPADQAGNSEPIPADEAGFDTANKISFENADESNQETLAAEGIELVSLDMDTQLMHEVEPSSESIESEMHAEGSGQTPVSESRENEIIDVDTADDDAEEISFDMSEVAHDGVDITDIEPDEITSPTDEDEELINLDATVELDDFDEFNSGMASLADDSQVTDTERLSDEVGMDPVLFKIYYDESQGYVESVNNMLLMHVSGEKLLLADKDLIRAFHTLYGSARTAEIESIASLCGATEKYVKARNEANDTSVPENAVETITEVVKTVEKMLEQVKQGKMPGTDKALQEKINKLVQGELQEQLQLSTKKGVTAKTDATLEFDQEDLGLDVSQDHLSVAPTQIEETDTPVIQTAVDYGQIDSDLIDIFLEEADELIESCEGSLLQLRDEPDDSSLINQLQRYMHTLKGGARMAELSPVGDLTHALESLVIKLSEGKVKADQVLFDHLNDALDTLSSMLESVKQRDALPDSSSIVSRLDLLMRGQVPEQRSVERFDVDIEELKVSDDERTGTLPHGRRASDVTDDNEEIAPRWGERATDTGRDTQEQVRVRADLLNDLVNYAGEVNIYHARMGKQVTDFGFNLSELESTVVRLKEQLRNLEIETEIQIRSSYERERESDQLDSGFDPLEMDKYSTIQQLSRSLSETAGDVESIKDILADITRDSETLLLQESRVSTELQEGLMRTRMVRFGGLGTRLRRIVRQTARELGKEVELEIVGDTNEVDRTVLDRIIAPLEHMLRNAVAHGIEVPAERVKVGKQETGRLVITVDRQGADVLILVKDDGAGISVEAIREKALKTGLIEPDNALSDHDVLQLILKSGFSTASSVSQIAGRGVGMDVVDSEIKQLGGLLEIDTLKGRGTTFTVRLPLTLAINQALLVNAGEDVYAIPLASIEGVVRITGSELQRFYDSGHTQYEFNGIEYELKHLGKLLTGSQVDYSSQLRLFPVLLAKVGEQHFALHVDDLVGRREIVVKPVGMQIGTIRGIAGATILADGRVVLILEMSALVVGEALFKQVQDEVETESEIEAPKAKETTIMVVDDSITIRKVTARMLERHGINVIAAKDGVDATNQLQDHVPDLMLLDIEMPRMDGFELATYIRNDDRLKDLPIIMITSRTGSKHKEKAMEIGVNQYLGKPYQEDELMKNIGELISVA